MKIKLKHIADSITEKSKVDNEVLSLDKVESFTGRIIDKTNEFSGDSFEGKKGDVVFAKIRPYLAKVAFLNKDMNVFTTLMLIRPKEMDGKFLFWSLINQPFIDKANSLAGGVTMPTIGWEQLKTLELNVPDLTTQQRIAAFLDERTGKIDALVGEFAKFKGNLQLQKRSLVSECVTKGLPSERDRAYKDSGVKWLGEVPASWEIKSFGKAVSLASKKTKATRNRISLDVIESGSGRLIPNEENDFAGDGVIFEKGDVLFGKLRPYLNKSYYATGDGDAYGDIHVYKPSDLVYGKYLFYFTLSDGFVKEANRTASGVKMPRASWTNITKFPFTIPPLDEQKRIADYLDTECAKIEALIGEIDNQVNLLKTYRKSLINEVVTGKVAV